MSSKEPAWLKRTRPCPFFSQGRCLFADSCNFLHDIKVRSAVNQTLLSAIPVSQPSLPAKPIFDPPAVIVNSASPRSIHLASPHTPASSIQDLSRYSGLLSVLSDVIGPPTAEDAISMSTPSSSSHDCSSLLSTSNAPVVGLESTSIATDMETGMGVPYTEPSLILDSGSEAPLFVCQMQSLTPEADQPVAKCLLVPDDDESTVFAGAMEAYVMGSEAEEEEGEKTNEDSTTILSDRHSTLSSFTGASLLATPPHSIPRESFWASAAEDGTVDLLSPVQLSVKFRPFSIPSLDSKVRRVGSIDSGYADGDNWAGPRQLPCSPPRNFQSPVTLLPYSRRASLSSPELKERRVSHDGAILHQSLHNPIQVIEEVESEESSGDNGDSAYAILEAYGSSISDGQDECGTCDLLQMRTAEEAAEENDKPTGVTAITRSPRHYPSEWLHPTKDCDLDPCNRPSSISEDNLSFKTALSKQPSYEDLNDISRASSIKQEPSYPFTSGCSTPNTSVFSHNGNANELAAQPTVGLHVYKPSNFDIGQIDSTGPPETSTSELCSSSGEVSIDSNALSISASACILQGPSLQKVVIPSKSASNTFHIDRCSPILGSSVEFPLDLSLVKDTLNYIPANVNDLRKSTSKKIFSPRERLSSAFQLDEQPSRSDSPVELPYSPLVGDACISAPLGLDKHPESDSKGHGHSPDDLHCNQLSPRRFTHTQGQSPCRDVPSQCLSFPLPPPFLPTEILANTTLNGENVSVPSEAAAVTKFEKGVPIAHTTLQDEERGQTRSGSDLTEKARPHQLPSVMSPNLNVDFTLRRSRAASDLTVKGASSPVATPTVRPDMSMLPLIGQPALSDSSQSLYDQYHDNASDDGSQFFSLLHTDIAPLAISRTIEVLEPRDLTPHVSQGLPTSSSEGESNSSRTQSARSKPVFRPLLTGRRSFSRSSLTECTSNGHFVNDGQSSPFIRPSTRLQTREVGSSMVPLGFRRHKPQPAPQSSHRELLRIRTDIAREDSSPGCSSAIHVSCTTRLPLPMKAMSAPPTGGLKQLCLSSVIDKRSSLLFTPTHSSSITSSILSLDQLSNAFAPQSPSVSSTTSFSRTSSLSSCEQIPKPIHHTLKRSSSSTLIQQVNDDVYSPSQPLAYRDSRSAPPPIQQLRSGRLSHYRAGSRNNALADGAPGFSKRTSTLSVTHAVDEEQEIDNGSTVSHPMQFSHADDQMHPASVFATPVHAIATPKPHLLFAIASDDVDQVRQVLESGEAGPNDSVGPQSALAFTLTNDKLTHKQEIVKALLAYGANPSALRNPTLNPVSRIEGSNERSGPPPETTLEGMDPATRYFVARADSAHTRQTSQLIYRSFFRPLTRVRYDVIGQDWALEQLFRVLHMHSQKLAVAPIVVLLCGPSGHGKSLLARKFGFLLDVPAHTVNMTTLRSTHDIWQSYSMSPYEEPSSCTLAEFLTENEGKRCVVVLDEIEKVEDQKSLWSLLMPWELGRCSLEAGKRHVDARNVIWLGTSNVGHELVFEHHEKRADPDERMSRDEYLELTSMLRPRVSHCLGASLVSRVTTVLPFVPFTLDERKAIAAEAVYTLAGEASRSLSSQDVESLVTKVLPSYHAGEGARSLHRAISSILVDTI